MEHEEIIAMLYLKLDANMDELRKVMGRRSKDHIFGSAREIAATVDVYNLLYCADYPGQSYPDEWLEYLLRFENPLKVVSDEWAKQHAMHNIADIRQVLAALPINRDAEYEHALDKEFLNPQQHAQQLG